MPANTIVLYLAAIFLVATLYCGEASAFFNFYFQKEKGNPSEDEVPSTNYYETLELEMGEEATEKDIKQAFRRLSRIYHPDVAKSEGDRNKYSDLNRAYEVLSDKKKRKMYDIRGEEGLKMLEKDQAAAGQQRVVDPFAQFFFGGQVGGGGGGLRGSDMETTVEVDLAKVYTGGSHFISFDKQKVCHKCKGTGARKSAGVKKCSSCGGSGVVRMRIMGLGIMQEVTQVCGECAGKGIIPKAKCPYCNGNKVVRGSSPLHVEIAQGVPEGHSVTFEMEGEESPDRIPGDLHVHLRTKKHPVFHRLPNGLDLEMKLSLSLTEALFGFSKKVPHLDGALFSIKHEGGLQYGSEIKIRGKGMPKHHIPSERGDLYTYTEFSLPKSLTGEQRKELERIWGKQ